MLVLILIGVNMPLRKEYVEKCLSVPERKQAYERNIKKAKDVASRVPLVRVDGNHITLKKLLEEGEIQISNKGSASSDTCKDEDLLGRSPCVYFYLGRACPQYGNYAIALCVDKTDKLQQTWVPFDTGCMVKFFKNKRNTGRTKQYFKEALNQASNRRNDFARFFALYFEKPIYYWAEEDKEPVLPHPEGLYEFQGDPKFPRWTAWTWEIGVEEEVRLMDTIVAWTIGWSEGRDEPHSYHSIVNQVRTLPRSAANVLGENRLIPRNSDDFAQTMEKWIIKECKL